MPNEQEQGNRSKAAAQVACDMSNKELRAELQRLGIDTSDSMTKKDLQQLLKMATELHHLKSSSGQPSDAASGGGVRGRERQRRVHLPALYRRIQPHRDR